MVEHLDDMIRSQPYVQRATNVALQRPLATQCRQARIVQMQRLVRSNPGRPVVFSGDTPEFPLGFGWRSRPRRGGDTHVATPELLAPLVQAVGIFDAIVGAGQREVYPPQRLRYGCRNGVQK